MKGIQITSAKAKPITRKAFPEDKTRRPVSIEFHRKFKVSDYWSGGSRDYTVFMDIRTGEVLSSESIPREQRRVAGNPYGLVIADVILSPHTALIEQSVFQGKTMPPRIILHPEVDTCAYMIAKLGEDIAQAIEQAKPKSMLQDTQELLALEA
jgi:hypothetical protein